MSPAVQIMLNLGLKPDPWQVEVLEGRHEQLLLNCCRQGGKSTVVAFLALVEALFQPGSKILLLSRSYRQACELYKTVLGYWEKLECPLKKRKNAEGLELANGSRIIPLPCKEETIRGYANVTLLIIDEAARVFDDLYRAVRPMLAVSNGRLILLSTPYGKRGFFYDCWANGQDDWKRIEVPADQVTRIKPRFLEKERRALGDYWFRQEYCCSFEACEGLVYPGLAGCVVPCGPSLLGGKKLGGIDFGFHSPFAALWGVVDADGILWLMGEHFCRGQPISYHATRIPKDVYWYCDPAGANERAELRCAGFIANKGENAIRPGIAAVSARIQSGSLKIVQGSCPNLLLEAGLYRYDPRDPDGESPIDEHNHAMDALRYLVSRLEPYDPAKSAGQRAAEPVPKKPWLRLDNEALWTPIGPDFFRNLG